LHLVLLGPFEARSGAGRQIPIRRRKAQALLGYLAFHPGERQPRDRLARLLWEEFGHTRARHALRQTLTELRQDLGPEAGSALELDGDTLALERVHVDVDVRHFEQLAASVSFLQLRRATTLYRGDLLEGASSGGAIFESWLAAERERLRVLLGHALERLLEHHARRGPERDALRVATRLLGLDPSREDVHRAVMRIHAQAGRRAAALRQYARCAAALRAELDVAPAEATTALWREILDGGSAAPERRDDGDVRTLAIRLASDVSPARAWEGAVWYYRVAADAAMRRSAYATAEALLDAAIGAARRIADGRARREHLVDIHLSFEPVLTPQGAHARLLAHLREAEAGARALGDRRRLALVATQWIFCGWWSGDPDLALTAGEEAMQAATWLADRDLAIVVRHRLAQLYFHLGDHARAIRAAREALAALGDESPECAYGQAPPPAVQCRIYLSLSLLALGDAQQAHDVAQVAEQVAQRTGSPFALALARNTQGVVDLARGRLDAACAALESVAELQRQIGGDAPFLSASGTLGFAYVRAGRVDEGVAAIEDATRASSQGPRYVHQRNLTFLALARLREGRTSDAVACAEAAIDLARGHRQRGGEATALHLLAQALPGDRRADAITACRKALDLGQELQLRPLVNRCRQTLADLVAHVAR
jgi:DNA-binding SARP family transcriptional activator